MSLGRSIGRKMTRAGLPRPHRTRKEPPVFNVNYKELEEKLAASVMSLKRPLNYDTHDLERITRELERVLMTYGSVSAEVSPTGRMTIQDPPIYVQAGTEWRRIPED